MNEFTCNSASVSESEEWERELLVEIQDILGVGTEKTVVTGVS